LLLTLEDTTCFWDDIFAALSYRAVEVPIRPLVKYMASTKKLFHLNLSGLGMIQAFLIGKNQFCFGWSTITLLHNLLCNTLLM